LVLKYEPDSPCIDYFYSELNSKTKMKKNVLIFGLVLGTILCINMIYMVNLCYTNPDFKGNDVVGYTALVVVFSLTFFGIRNYRNKELNGEISFGKAFKTGVLIAFAGSTMYVVVWLFYYYLFVPDFIDVFIPHVLKETSPADLPAKTKEMANFKEMYKNPVFVVLITYSEVFPIGLIVALVSALVLKRKKKPETTA
jgi:amino acid transporter